MFKKMFTSIVLACVSISPVALCEQANAAKTLAPRNLGLHWVSATIVLDGKTYNAHVEWYGSPDKIEPSTVLIYTQYIPIIWTRISRGENFLNSLKITGVVDVPVGPGNPSYGKTPGMRF
jgi:hypothetical protein